MVNSRINLSRAALLATLLTLLTSVACHRADVRSSLSANQFMGNSGDPVMLAAYQPSGSTVDTLT